MRCHCTTSSGGSAPRKAAQAVARAQAAARSSGGARITPSLAQQRIPAVLVLLRFRTLTPGTFCFCHERSCVQCMQ